MNAYYRLYVISCLRLTGQLVIKSKYTAKSLNSLMSAMGYAVDPDDPRTWKYYMNLAGLAHASNVPMEVISLDTLEIIQFTQANLRIHRMTRREYAFGTRYYNELVEKYPDQEALIKGILNPVDINAAIAAPDHNILFYDTTLVESNEQQLIPALQDYITFYFHRYDNSDYGLFDKFYYPGLFGVMASKLTNEIMLIRKAAAKTDQAHSYHVRQYLLSFSPVGKEFDFMTQKQRMWLYRNIRYLNLNLGREEILQLTTDHILTDRGFSLASYELAHDYENTLTTLVADVRLDRKTLNGIDPAQGSNEKTVGEVLDMELPLARDNPVVRDDTEVDTVLAMEKLSWSKLKTKVLESNVVDRTDAEPFTLTDVLLNHWIYLSHYDMYKSVVTFVNPANGDPYRMTVKNAFIFYLYAYNRSVGIELINVPVISANRVRRIPMPEKAELMASSTRDKVPEYYIDYILDTSVDIQPSISIDAFRETCVEIQKVMIGHREMRHYNCDYKAEGQLHTIIDRCYMDIRIDLAGSISYEQWLNDNGVDISSMGELEYDLMAKAIFKSATGGDLGVTTGVRAIHASMIRIMKELSSYSVQFIAQINDSPIKIIDGKFPKLSIPHNLTEQHTYIETPWPLILDVDAYEHSTMDVKVWYPKVTAHVRDERTIQKVPVDVGIRLIHTGSMEAPVESPVPQVRMLRKPVTDLSDYPYSGIAGYLPIPPQDLGDLVISNTLPGYSLLTEARRVALLRL